MEHVWDVVFHFMDVGLTNLNQMFNAVIKHLSCLMSCHVSMNQNL